MTTKNMLAAVATRLPRTALALALASAALMSGLSVVTAPAHAASAQDKISLNQYVAKRDATRATARNGGASVAASCATGVYITSAANSRIVSTELSQSGGRQNMLRARATAVGPWELFTICYDANFDYFLSEAANQYVSAELTYTGNLHGMLRAPTHVVGPWEQYIIDCPGYCSIYSQANRLYMSAELSYPGGDNAMLRARSATLGPWEQFT